VLLPSSPLLWAAVLVLATSMPFRGVAAEQIAPRARATTSPDDSVDDWGDEDDSLGFGDLALGHGEKNRKPALATSKGEADLISVGGFWRSDNAVWLNRLDSGPWSRLRQSLDLSASMDGDWWRLRAAAHGAVDLAYLRDRDSFDSATKETYESVLLIRELLATATLGSVTYRLANKLSRPASVRPWAPWILSTREISETWPHPILKIFDCRFGPRDCGYSEFAIVSSLPSSMHPIMACAQASLAPSAVRARF